MNPNPKQRSRGRGNNGGNPNRPNHGGHGGGHSGGGGHNHGGHRNINVRSQVFDSNGPEGRIRGNAHQVMEKYLALARDAASQGDRHMAENFYQHAEHYFRLINAYNQNNGQRRPPMSTPAGDQAEMTGDDEDQNERRDDQPEMSAPVEASDLSRAADTAPVEDPEPAPPAPQPVVEAAVPEAAPEAVEGEIDAAPVRKAPGRPRGRRRAAPADADREAAEPAGEPEPVLI